MKCEAISLHFESRLGAPAPRVWDWIASTRGISAEMWPFFRMTFPKGVRSLGEIRVRPGVRICRSYLFLFGLLPIGYSDLTLIDLNPGQGFVEQSRGATML